MISRYLLTALCLLHIISNTETQYVQSQAPAESCSSSSITLRCPNSYAIIVKSAFYGVSKIPNQCSYTPGDCIADAMSTATCMLDSTQCNIYATRKKLPQCNDDFSSYMHIEYDCVPISMNDPSLEYNICQNSTPIVTNQGVIRSPGYPTQFQTTPGECVRVITAPNNKTIRLWLTDLYIGSVPISATPCSKDYLIVVDSAEAIAQCGRKRFMYPYLCSSTILIQYLTVTSNAIYKGMRMYFEFIDRPANDGCSSSGITVTPFHETTSMSTVNPVITPLPPLYAVLGIASSIVNFQLCRGKFI
jgi:hypothetical protein